jgi:predicted nucleic acid-binding protein
MPTILDSNVLLDLIQRDPVWYSWSAERLAHSRDNGLCINAVVFAECAAGYTSRVEFHNVLRQVGVDFENIPEDAAYLAGRTHLEYRKRGGLRLRTLPDFFIGAHASVRDFTLVTRDPAIYRGYFPKLDIIAPDTHP